MAKASIERTLQRMHAVLDDAYVRGQLDKAPQKVIVTLFNITQAFKHGYGLAQQKQKNLPFVEDEVFEKAAEKALEKAGITVNKNMVPFDKRSPFITSGIRVGTPAITTRNMKTDEMKKIAKLVKELAEKTDEEWLELYKKMKPVLLYNREKLLEFGNNTDGLAKNYLTKLKKLVHGDYQENYSLL